MNRRKLGSVTGDIEHVDRAAEIDVDDPGRLPHLAVAPGRDRRGVNNRGDAVLSADFAQLFDIGDVALAE